MVSATGTWSYPFIPGVPGRDRFRGPQVHSAHYIRPEDFAGQRVLVVADARWVTLEEPKFLPDDVDGRVLFERAVARMKAGPGDTPVGGIGDIVMVPPVLEARKRCPDPILLSAM